MLGATGTTAWSITTQQGAYGHVIDPGVIPYVVTEQSRINTVTAQDPSWGTAISRPLDRRTAHGNVEFAAPEYGIRYADADGNHKLFEATPTNANDFFIQYNVNGNGNLTFIGQNGAMFMFDNKYNVNYFNAQAQYAGGTRYVGPEDLTTTTGKAGEIMRHDGTGTPPAGFYHRSEDGTVWIGFGETSGTTI
jgi:hypothetical protein